MLGLSIEFCLFSGRKIVNRKVWIISEKEDFCIGTVRQVLEANEKLRSLQEAVQCLVKDMLEDECFDDESISFTIEIR